MPETTYRLRTERSLQSGVTETKFWRVNAGNNDVTTIPSEGEGKQ